MSDIVLSVENLSKQYRVGEISTGTLSNDMKRWWAQLRGKEDPFSLVGQVNDRTKKSESDFVWALKDINFQVQRGDVLGIVGKNGAGKSTLLKLISRITSPTTGSIKARGRIASLLEVGTGMHPEMTARENIYLNGAIMGMTKREISRKFDEIVDFAGCALYVDTPVKRYSSGMRVRLGFAVAAFLEPEILIVDEVLAVGDAEFQKKAIGKMKDVSSGEGRTVLFVSHNMESIEALCTSCTVLKNGTVLSHGKTNDMIELYLNDNREKTTQLLGHRTDRKGNGRYRIMDTTVCTNNQPTGYLKVGQQGQIILDVVQKDNVKIPISISIGIHDSKGIRVSTLSSMFFPETLSIDRNFKVEFALDKVALYAGEYFCNVFLREGEQGDIVDWVQDAFILRIEGGDFYGAGKNNVSQGDKVFINHKINLI
ncbi:ABC transporter ATP-binding protein [Aureispira anguillae]|uniref:ABC transporter ATP-binding protein n=1 Tax=Aureispira anguillae TaxID=2864201 RepID=A0A915YKW2_9BACT|nr:ABC transporter ATP-binding protein [Aureispira anguillae]BDS14658.1 ABC transporter ATP-binding protein [Aureispira anguillae]